MIITPCGRGIHRREIVGIEKLKSSLPPKWYGFSNLEIAVGPGRGREIDVVIVAEDRIFLIDLKDWNGVIESDGGHWLQNGNDHGASPVTKIIQNARDVGTLLSGDLKKRKELRCPLVQGLVLVTGKAEWSRVAATERNSVRHIDDFMKVVANAKAREDEFGYAGRVPLMENDWKDRLSKFFNAPNGVIKPGRRRFGRYVAASDKASFEHPSKLYTEYEAVGENAALNLGTIRLWDFTKAEAKFLTPEGRAEIAGREREVISYLRDRNEVLESALLTPQDEDPERGVSYWEVYDRRQRLHRLSEFSVAQSAVLGRDAKVELGRQILARVAALHATGAAHLDLGGHSIWLQAPSNVRLSHLMAAHYPGVNTLGASRFQFLACARLPETLYEEDPGDPRRRDVFLAGVCVHVLLFGKHPPQDADGLAHWAPETDAAGEFAALHDYFERSLSLDQSARYADAGAALEAYNAATTGGRSTKEVVQGLERFQEEFKRQSQFFKAFQEDVLLRASDRVEVWVSGEGDDRSVVKLWKRAAWSDQAREGSRILDFLERADDFRRSPQPGCALVLKVCWLGDAIGIVQRYVEGTLLSEAIERRDEFFDDPLKALSFVNELCSVVLALHDRGSAHGDLKPDNVVIRGEERVPVLIDLLDFSPSDEGDRLTPAYSPPLAGGRLERDRFAVTKIAEEILGAWLDGTDGAGVRKAVAECRDNVPENGTLLPLVEALEAALAPPVERSTKRLTISILNGKGGTMFPDEGKMYLRRYIGAGQSVLGFFLRGC